MGLDDVRFGGLCTTIVATDPLPTLGEIYAKIIREEQRLASARVREQQQDAVGFVTRQNDLPTYVRQETNLGSSFHGGRQDKQLNLINRSDNTSLIHNRDRSMLYSHCDRT